MLKRTWILAALLGIVTASAASADSLAPSALSLHPDTYDGTTVTVTGKVMHFEASTSPKITGYQLCDNRCIIVLDRTNAVHQNGTTATVTGVFFAKWSGPQRSFSNCVIVG